MLISKIKKLTADYLSETIKYRSTSTFLINLISDLLYPRNIPSLAKAMVVVHVINNANNKFLIIIIF